MYEIWNKWVDKYYDLLHCDVFFPEEGGNILFRQTGTYLPRLHGVTPSNNVVLQIVYNFLAVVTRD
jgi:hypothetical protein